MTAPDHGSEMHAAVILSLLSALMAHLLEFSEVIKIASSWIAALAGLLSVVYHVGAIWRMWHGKSPEA